MSFSADDAGFMARALQLAQNGLYTTHPNPRVGCVIVKHNHIVGEGWHAYAGQPHAEVHALHAAGDAARDADVYVTLEPCSHTGRTPPCANALIAAGVKRVFVAMVDPNPQVAGNGLALLTKAGIETHVGLLEAQAHALNCGFIHRMVKQRPWIRIKSAMSLDGRTAMRSGESFWITGEAARQDVQYWRARSSAVLTGIGTILYDDPSLNVRLSADELNVVTLRQPDRIVLDTHLRMPLHAQWLKTDGQKHIYTCQHDHEKIAKLTECGVRVRVMPTPELKLADVFADLAACGMNEIHVEAGATLTGALVCERLVDELLIYMAPHLMGMDARGLFDLPFTQMQQRLALAIQDIRAVGQDWRILAHLV